MFVCFTNLCICIFFILLCCVVCLIFLWIVYSKNQCPVFVFHKNMVPFYMYQYFHQNHKQTLHHFAIFRSISLTISNRCLLLFCIHLKWFCNSKTFLPDSFTPEENRIPSEMYTENTSQQTSAAPSVGMAGPKEDM